MGTTMESIQNAYRGFSRGNFTMLDNLSLGFSGTKEGMQELLDKAEQISGIKYDISSYSDIVQAIHVVQQEMGITGTTAAEAADTIQGSAGSMAAAWENLKVEFAREDGDIGQSLDILVNSALTVFDNIEPKIERALGGVTQFVGKAAPIIVEKLPPMIEQIVPPLLTASGSLVVALGKGVAQALPALLKSTGSLVSGLYGSFIEKDLGAFDWIREDAIKVVDATKEVFGRIDFSKITDAVSGFGDTFEKMGDRISWVYTEFLAPSFEWAANDMLPTFLEGIGAAANIAAAAFDLFKDPAIALWENFIQPMSEGALMLVVDGLKGIADVVDGVEWSGFWEDLFNGNFGEDWEEGWKEIKDGLSDAGAAIDDFFNTSEFGESWNEFWQGVGEGIYDFQANILDPFVDDWVTGFRDIKQFVSDVKTGFTDFVDAIVAGWDMIGDAIDSFIQAHKDGIEMIEDFLGGNQKVSVNEDAMADFFGKARAQAKGGIIRKPTVTLSGEAGDEANIPLYNDNLGIRQIADAITRNMATASNIINITVNGGNGDPETIAEIIKDKIDTLLNENRVAASRAIGGVSW